jgi:hypothetical protein
VPGIVRKRSAQPDTVMEFAHGRSVAVRVGDETFWRSDLTPGWSWDVDLKPWAGDLTSCPLTHREYVAQGRVRYLMTDGTEEIAESGDFLFIQPGHRAWVVGDETCVLIDW